MTASFTSWPADSMLLRHFPSARIVADRFHVIRLILHHFMEFFRLIALEIKHHRGSLAVARSVQKLDYSESS